MRTSVCCLACLLSLYGRAAAAQAKADSSSGAPCQPVDGSRYVARLSNLAGAFRLQLVVDSGRRTVRGLTATGILSLRATGDSAWQLTERAGAATTRTRSLYDGTLQMLLAAVGVRTGVPDATPLPAATLEEEGRDALPSERAVFARIIVEPPHPGLIQTDGVKLQLVVREVSADQLRGSWTAYAGLGGPYIFGRFCASGRRDR